jgi:hypothetical protein
MLCWRSFQLQMIDIWNVPQLKYLFGECDHQHQFQNHIMLPNLENLKLCYLHNLIGISPKYCQAKWPSESLKTLTVRHCAKLPTSWIAMMAGSNQRQHHRNEVSILLLKWSIVLWFYIISQQISVILPMYTFIIWLFTFENFIFRTSPQNCKN